MDKSTKAFIIASLVYLFFGALFGTLLTFGIGQPYLFRFAHMHLLLLGFMAMMVYGVGYFILPRFNGTTIKWEWMIGLHFVVSNVGLLGLCFADLGFRPFFAVVSLAGVFLFALNMIVTMLAAPSVIERMARTAEASSSSDGSPQPAPAASTPPVSTQAARAGAQVALTGDETIGQVLETWPQLEEVVRTFFGDGCFTCPGQATESLIQAALVHNIEPELLISQMQAKLDES